MKFGEDPIDFFTKLDEQRLRLADMGETLTDESYEDIILRALPKEYDFIRQQSYMNRNFGLTGIKTTATNMFIDDLSRKSSASAVPGRGVVMQTTQGHGEKLRYKRDKDNKKRGGGASQWCSFHRTRTHSDAECKKQQELKGKPPELANFAHIGSAHLAAAKVLPQRLDSLSPQFDPLRVRLVPRLPQRLRSSRLTIFYRDTSSALLQFVNQWFCLAYLTLLSLKTWWLFSFGKFIVVSPPYRQA